MRSHGNLALKTTVTAKDIEYVLSLRRTYDAQRKRLEIVENALVEFENDVLARIQTGVPVVSPHEVQIKSIERRNVAWKSICVELASAEYVDSVLNSTAPSISYRLLIKEAA